uniref:NADH-ubiquinone oxidoreductase chain 3 n=2 Tax=Sarcoptes scabiei TaxID=52283 RepID=A0A347ZN85_SARSC|nr:NADH dehydrogenase subunit 3 [Sarcoptes scabiei]
MMLILIITIILLMLMFFFLIMILTKFNKMNFYKNSPFECGFQNMTKFSTPFSFPFFIYSIMFLIFDLEISILSSFPIFIFFKVEMWFLMVLIMIITFYEWKKGMMKWIFSKKKLVST